MGTAGRSSVKQRAYGKKRTGRQSQRERMGDIYCGSDKKAKRKRRPYRISALGQRRETKKRADNESEAVHPSPLSAYNGFFGCKHFSKCNEFLEKCGKEKIDWSLPE